LADKCSPIEKFIPGLNVAAKSIPRKPKLGLNMAATLSPMEGRTNMARRTNYCSQILSGGH